LEISFEHFQMGWKQLLANVDIDYLEARNKG